MWYVFDMCTHIWHVYTVTVGSLRTLTNNLWRNSTLSVSNLWEVNCIVFHWMAPLTLFLYIRASRGMMGRLRVLLVLQATEWVTHYYLLSSFITNPNMVLRVFNINVFFCFWSGSSRRQRRERGVRGSRIPSKCYESAFKQTSQPADWYRNSWPIAFQ